MQLEDKVQQNKSAAVVMAIPRGGIIIGDVIASELGAKLDVVVSRKIGVSLQSRACNWSCNA